MRLHSPPSRASRLVLPVRRWPERRVVVLSASALAFAAVFAWRQTSADAQETISLLYVVSVALVALELGLAAGLAAAALALGLVAVWSSTVGVDVGAVGMVTYGVSFVAVGAIAGRFSDQLRGAQARQRLLLGSGLRLAHLGGATDLPATLARDAHALSGARGVRVELGGRTAQVGRLEDAPPDFPERLPIELRGAHLGTLSIAPGANLGPADRVTLAVLALQAAVAEENRRLLERERERAAMRAELRDARVSLERRAHQLRGMLDHQERERSQVAQELHENAAQMLAAVLLGLGALERELGSAQRVPALGALRSDVDSTLQSLRALAVSLRPPTLALGLPAALEGLAERAAAQGRGEVTVAVGRLEGLGADLETMIYRVAEEALATAAGACAVRLRDGDRRAIEIVAEPGARPLDSERLAALSGRLELAGGTLAVSTGALRATIPLPREAGAFANGSAAQRV